MYFDMSFIDYLTNKMRVYLEGGGLRSLFILSIYRYRNPKVYYFGAYYFRWAYTSPINVGSVISIASLKRI
jgi:hypothetical protein